MNVEGSSVTLNLTDFFYNRAANGGALFVGGEGITNRVHDSVFEDNTAGDHGGAIDWLASAGEVLRSNFTRNSAVYGGAIYLNNISSQSLISDVIFTRNVATENGGAIDCNSSSMGLFNTKFLSNTAKYGGALCREADATWGSG